MNTYSRLGPELTEVLSQGTYNLHGDIGNAVFISFRLESFRTCGLSQEAMNFSFLFSVSPSFLEYLVKVCLPQQLIWVHIKMSSASFGRGKRKRSQVPLGSITSRCSGKWARTHPPKERLDACDFLCWFKPIMLPPADFRLAKIVAEIIKSKQKVLPWSIAWRSDFDVPETLGEILESEGTQRFVRLFVVNFSFNDCHWRNFASSRIFSRCFRSQ